MLIICCAKHCNQVFTLNHSICHRSQGLHVNLYRSCKRETIIELQHRRAPRPIMHLTKRFLCAHAQFQICFGMWCNDKLSDMHIEHTKCDRREISQLWATEIDFAVQFKFLMQLAFSLSFIERFCCLWWEQKLRLSVCMCWCDIIKQSKLLFSLGSTNCSFNREQLLVNVAMAWFKCSMIHPESGWWAAWTLLRFFSR